MARDHDYSITVYVEQPQASMVEKDKNSKEPAAPRQLYLPR